MRAPGVAKNALTRQRFRRRFRSGGFLQQPVAKCKCPHCPHRSEAVFDGIAQWRLETLGVLSSDFFFTMTRQLAISRSARSHGLLQTPPPNPIFAGPPPPRFTPPPRPNPPLKLPIPPKACPPR